MKLRADGFYFNEIEGEISEAQLTLYAISDISDNSSVNVNILSHLENNRILFLINKINNGDSYEEAKDTALSEILSIFSIEKADIQNSELLDISEDGDDNAILLAISIITQGLRTTADLLEILADISTDKSVLKLKGSKLTFGVRR